MKTPTLGILALFALFGLGSLCRAEPNSQDPWRTGALTRLRHGIAQEEKAHHTDSLLRQLRDLRDLQVRYGSLDSAMATGLRIVAINPVTSDRVAMAGDWTALSEIGKRTGDLNNAVVSAKRALLILKTTGQRQATNLAIFNLLDLFLESGRTSEFKSQSEEALGSFQREGNLADQARIQYRQGKYLIGQGHPADALTLLHRVLRDRQWLQGDHEAALVLFTVAQANVDLAQWGPARSAFNEGLRLFPGAPSAMPVLHGLDSRIYQGQGDLVRALEQERAQGHAKDSSFSATIADRAARVQMLYDVRSKDQELEELGETHRNTVAELAKADTKVRWLMLLAACLSVGLLTLGMLRIGQAYTVRRTRLRNTLIKGQAKQMQAKSMELERQNLLLSHALMEGGDRGRPEPAGLDELSMVELFLQARSAYCTGLSEAEALEAVRHRVQSMALLHGNIAKVGGTVNFNVKAHLAYMSAALLKERGLSDQLGLVFDINEEEAFKEDILPISLLFHELLLISMGHATTTGRPAKIGFTLRRLGLHQCELLYTDENGGITGRSMNADTMGNSLVQALSKALGGSILLLKSDVTVFQLTYLRGVRSTLRKAS